MNQHRRPSGSALDLLLRILPGSMRITAVRHRKRHPVMGGGEGEWFLLFYDIEHPMRCLTGEFCQTRAKRSAGLLPGFNRRAPLQEGNVQVGKKPALL